MSSAMLPASLGNMQPYIQLYFKITAASQRFPEHSNVSISILA
jgi:hypothetical protein